MTTRTVEAVREERPGPKWRRLFRTLWPAYRRWFLQKREGPSLEVCRRALERSMPELVPTYERLLVQARADDEMARFLTLFEPAPYVRGCSQLVWSNGEPALIRNYDYTPGLWDGVVLASRWRDRWVVGMSDCAWGLLDGMNEAGLVVSLAFGGRRGVGSGFGSPLILRYLLECCTTAGEAADVLRRTPTHMAYNVTVVDRRGEFFTAALAPGAPAEVRRRPVATNHQEGGDWPEYERSTSTRERERFLESLLEDGEATLDDLADRFLRAPLYAGEYRRGQGTLYTAVYRPARGVVEYRWPQRWMVQSIDAFSERRERVAFGRARPVSGSRRSSR